jgi:opacity protein-like surface antigen
VSVILSSILLKSTMIMTKKIVLVSLLFGALASNVQAQNETAERISRKYRFGLFGNVGSTGLKPVAATASGNGNDYDVKKEKGRIGYGIGLTVEKPLTESATLYSGLGVDWYGGQISAARKVANPDTAIASDYARNANITYKLQNINLPIGLRLKASNITEKMFLYGRVGADLGLVIGRNAAYTIVGQPPIGSLDTLQSSGSRLGIKTVNPLQVGWHFGAGVEYKVAKNAAFAEILYRNSILDATLPQFRTDAEYKFADGNVRTNNIAIRIGYFF